MKNKIYILHGWAYDTKKWEPFVQELHDAQYNVNLLKIPGLTGPLSEPWKLNDYVEWAEREIKGNEVIIIGHSFGGQIAARLAARKPSWLGKLVLIAPAGIRDRSTWLEIKRRLLGMMAKVGKVIIRKDGLKKWFYRFIREKDYVEASPLMKEVMKAVLADEVVKDLSKIVSPTLVVWGSRDQVTPVKHAKIFKELIPHSRIAMIEGARHSPQFTHTRKTLDKILKFLEA